MNIKLIICGFVFSHFFISVKLNNAFEIYKNTSK